MAEINYAGEFVVEECTLYTVGGLEVGLEGTGCNHNCF